MAAARARRPSLELREFWMIFLMASSSRPGGRAGGFLPSIPDRTGVLSGVLRVSIEHEGGLADPMGKTVRLVVQGYCLKGAVPHEWFGMGILTISRTVRLDVFQPNGWFDEPGDILMDWTEERDSSPLSRHEAMHEGDLPALRIPWDPEGTLLGEASGLPWDRADEMLLDLIRKRTDRETDEATRECVRRFLEAVKENEKQMRLHVEVRTLLRYAEPEEIERALRSAVMKDVVKS